MHKLVFATFAILAILQVLPASEAFIIKTVSVEKGYPPLHALPSLPSPDAAISALTASKNALVQTVTNAVTEKLNTITSLVGSIVQAKINAKTNLLTAVTNAKSGFVKKVSGLVPSKPVYTKTITFGWKKPLFITTTVLPVTTTAAVPTTTGQSSGYARYVRRN